MTPEEIIGTITERVKDTANVKVVFGDPVTTAGVTVIPVATVKVAGGGGGGRGRALALPVEGEELQEGGIGIGLQITARPLGYIEVKDGAAKLVPIPDVTKIAVGGMIASTLAIFMITKVVSKFLSKRAEMRRLEA